MMTTINVTTEQKSLSKSLNTTLLENCLHISNDIELENLELIVKGELAEGLPSDTEGVYF